MLSGTHALLIKAESGNITVGPFIGVEKAEEWNEVFKGVLPENLEVKTIIEELSVEERFCPVFGFNPTNMSPGSMVREIQHRIFHERRETAKAVAAQNASTNWRKEKRHLKDELLFEADIATVVTDDLAAALE